MAQGRPALHYRERTLLTEVESTIMKVVWCLGSATVKDVTAALSDDETRKVTTVATILKILGNKGFLSAEKVARSLLYRPRISLADYQQTVLQELTYRLFEGSSVKVFEACLTEFSLQEHELEYLARKIDARLRS